MINVRYQGMEIKSVHFAFSLDKEVSGEITVWSPQPSIVVVQTDGGTGHTSCVLTVDEK